MGTDARCDSGEPTVSPPVEQVEPVDEIGFFARTFQSFGIRNFRLFFIGQLVSNTGNWLTIVALTLLVLHATHSGFYVGLLTACQFGPILVLSAWAGSIADRADKHKLLFITQGGEMAQSAALAVLAFVPGTPVWAFFVLAVVGGVLLAFDNPIRRSFVPEMVPRELIPNAVMLYSTLVNASRIFGPALAGVLVVTLGYGWAFTFDSVSYVAVITALAMMRRSELRRRPPAPRVEGAVREGVRYVRSMPTLWISFVMLAAVGTFSYEFNVVVPLFVEQGLGGSDTAYTVAYALFSVGALIGALAAAHRSDVDLRLIIAGCAALGVTMVGLALVPSLTWVYPVIVVVGVASIIYMTTTTAIVQVRARPSMHGRVLALQSVLLIGTNPIGGPILGAVSDRFGARAPVGLGAVVALATAGWGAWVMQRHREELARPPDTDRLPLVSVGLDASEPASGIDAGAAVTESSATPRVFDDDVAEGRTWPRNPQPGDPMPS